MTTITVTGGMITFKDTATGLTKQIGQNKLWLMFKADTVNFLQVDIPTDGYDGTPFWACRAANMTINGQTYTIDELKQGQGLSDLFSSMSFTIEIVDELPETGDPSTIYLVENGDTGTYTEYLWLAQEQTYEELGSVADVDLGNYYNKSQVDQLLALKANISSLATVATSGSYNDLSDKPVIPTVPTNVSAFNNDAGYLTEHQSLDNYYNKTQTDNLLAGKANTSALAGKQDTLVSGTNIKTINNQSLLGSGNITIEGGGGGDMSNYYTKTETNTLLNAKADSNSLATVATSGNYNDLSNKPTIPTVPTNVSAFVNDAGYLTQHQSLADVFGKVNYDSSTKRINFYGKDDTSMTNVLGYVDASSFVVDGMVEDVRIENGNLVIDFNTDSGITDITIPLTDIFDPSNYYTKTEVDTALAGKANSSSLATVATSGSYNDLTNKPTIPAAQVNSDWNASSGVAQILNKPDLSNYVTSSQVEETINYQMAYGWDSYTDVDPNDIGVTINATGPGIYTDQEEATHILIPTAMTVNQNDEMAVSGGAVYTALSGKQDTLVSGTNIKTINNQSLLGSGNITISGGGSGTVTGVKMNNGSAISPDSNGVVDLGTVVTTVDSALSSTSTNPVENRAIYAVVGDIEAALQAINGTTNA